MPACLGILKCAQPLVMPTRVPWNCSSPLLRNPLQHVLGKGVRLKRLNRMMSGSGWYRNLRPTGPSPSASPQSTLRRHLRSAAEQSLTCQWKRNLLESIHSESDAGAHSGSSPCRSALTEDPRASVLIRNSVASGRGSSYGTITGASVHAELKNPVRRRVDYPSINTYSSDGDG